MKIHKGFRVDPVIGNRLETVADRIKMTQTDLIEKLINALWEENQHDWFRKETLIEERGFDRFREYMHQRMDVILHDEEPNAK